MGKHCKKAPPPLHTHHHHHHQVKTYFENGSYVESDSEWCQAGIFEPLHVGDIKIACDWEIAFFCSKDDRKV